MYCPNVRAYRRTHVFNNILNIVCRVTNINHSCQIPPWGPASLVAYELWCQKYMHTLWWEIYCIYKFNVIKKTIIFFKQIIKCMNSHPNAACARGQLIYLFSGVVERVWGQRWLAGHKCWRGHWGHERVPHSRKVKEKNKWWSTKPAGKIKSTKLWSI